MGSQGVAAWIAQGAFWVLIALGVVFGEIRARAAIFFVGLWLIGYIALPRIVPNGALFVTSYLAIVDIILVFIIFKGDLRLTP
jgi:hypothetical protein